MLPSMKTSSSSPSAIPPTSNDCLPPLIYNRKDLRGSCADEGLPVVHVDGDGDGLQNLSNVAQQQRSHHLCRKVRFCRHMQVHPPTRYTPAILLLPVSSATYTPDPCLSHPLTLQLAAPIQPTRCPPTLGPPTHALASHPVPQRTSSQPYPPLTSPHMYRLTHFPDPLPTTALPTNTLPPPLHQTETLATTALSATALPRPTHNANETGACSTAHAQRVHASHQLQIQGQHVPRMMPTLNAMHACNYPCNEPMQQRAPRMPSVLPC